MTPSAEGSARPGTAEARNGGEGRRGGGFAWAGVAAALAALVTWSFWQRWTLLAASPFPVGIDGYFYPIQLRSLLEDGALAYPASPLAFWLMAPLAAVTDPITGAKLGAALFGALIAVPAYGVGSMLGRSRGAGLIAAALATTSAGSAFLTFEFVKNGVGLTVALAALWLVLRALETPSRGRLVGAVVGILAAMLAHKMAAAIVLAIAVPAAIVEAHARHAVTLRVVGGGLAGLGVLVVVLGLVFPDRFVSPRDLTMLSNLWTSEARWEAPALVLPRDTLAMGHEALIGGLLALGAAVLLVRSSEPRSRRVAGGGVVGIALMIALPWLAVTDPMGLGFRLRLVAFVPMALCAAIVVPWLVGTTRSLVRDGLLAAAALAIVLLMPRERAQGKIVAHPAMVAAVQALAGKLPEGATAIVPERHIMFMVAWYTRAPSRLAPDRVPAERRWRVLPLAFTGQGSPLDDALMAARTEPGLVPPVGTHPRHPNGLVLVPEATWEWLLAHLPPGDVHDYFARWPTI
ncbi:MAG: glycosyltransferase family 39 protein [Kofleriaceae bacterium]|nr:glycosyltransferase family 39 protein [Kofleriaceae bacterium]